MPPARRPAPICIRHPGFPVASHGAPVLKRYQANACGGVSLSPCPPVMRHAAQTLRDHAVGVEFEVIDRALQGGAAA